jgi:CheY-like chemotaxis protein
MPTVLVVDDDADVLDAVAEVLALEGFAVRQARGGAAALDLLRTEHTPGVVLLDARMDGVDGPAVWEWIRRNPATRGVRVVFMTGDRRFQPLDGASVLEKPFGVADLLDALRVALEAS